MSTSIEIKVYQSWVVGQADVALAFVVSGYQGLAHQIADEVLNKLATTDVELLPMHPEYFRARSQLEAILKHC